MSSDHPSGAPLQPPELLSLLRERGAPLLEALAAHSPGARESAEATATYAFVTAAGIGFDRPRCEIGRELGRLSSIGLVYVPVAVLETPAAERTPAQIATFEAHHEAGYGLAIGAGIPEHMSGCLLRVRERFDGGGPEELAGQRIPLESRVVRAAAACQAALAAPPEEGLSVHRSAVRALNLQAGEQLDPQLTEVLIGVLERASTA